jgi:hypothetical protein
MIRLPVVISWVVLAGCAKPPIETMPEVGAIPARDFYPLAVGNAWSYQVTLLGETKQIEVKVLKEDNGIFEDSSGAQLFADAFGVRDQKRYLLRDPVEIGTEWSNVVSVSSIERYKIVAAAQGCDAPAGHFEDCAVVESRNRVQEGKVLVNELTFAPKVGLIRIATLLENNGQKVPQATLVLTKYEVKGAPVQPPKPSNAP